MSNPFGMIILLLNSGASIWFLCRGNMAWALIYFGAALIQTGSLWLTRN